MSRFFSSMVFIFSLLMTSSISAEPQIGQPAPEFSLQDQNGKTHSLADYRGKTVVLEWTNPECPFVKRHYKAKTMTTLSKIYSNKNVVWLAVDSSHFVTPESSNEWIKEHKIKHPILQDPSGEVGRKYKAKTTPHMYVVSPEGNLIYNGGIDNDSWGMKKASNLINYVDTVLKALLLGETPAYAETKPYGCSIKYK